MTEHEWAEYRGSPDSEPKPDRKIEVRGPAHISGVYCSADDLLWNYLPNDGSVRWRYMI